MPSDHPYGLKLEVLISPGASYDHTEANVSYGWGGGGREGGGKLFVVRPTTDPTHTCFCVWGCVGCGGVFEEV